MAGISSSAMVSGGSPSASRRPRRGGPAAKPWDGVLVASFDIQVFGESKMAKANVRRGVGPRRPPVGDVVAVQEVRAKSDSIVRVRPGRSMRMAVAITTSSAPGRAAR